MVRAPLWQAWLGSRSQPAARGAAATRHLDTPPCERCIPVGRGVLSAAETLGAAGCMRAPHIRVTTLHLSGAGGAPNWCAKRADGSTDATATEPRHAPSIFCP